MKNSYEVVDRFVFMVIVFLALFISMQGMAFAETAAVTALPEEPMENAEVTIAPEEEVECAVAIDAPVDETHQGDWWNILLLGGDSRDSDAYGRTDSIIILSINKKDGKAKMTSVMRDTWVNFPGTGESGKINAANVYGGPQLSMETVNAYFGTDIRDYILVNMVGLVKMIDKIGGIDIPVTAGERKWINAYAKDYLHNFGSYDGATSLGKAGDSVHLNGLLALSYCRIRYIGNDYQRTERQRTVLQAALNKLKGDSAAMIAMVMSTAFANVETNLSLSDIIALASFGLRLTADDIDQFRIPVDGTFNGGMKNGIWSIRPNFEKNATLLSDFIYGKGA